jgi:hypothetical protein
MSASDVTIMCASDGFWDTFPDAEVATKGGEMFSNDALINASGKTAVSVADAYVNLSLNRWQSKWKIKLSNGYTYPDTHPIPASEVDDISVAVLCIA